MPDPFDLSEVEVRWNNTSFGTAVAHEVGAHVHPKATSHLEDPDDMPVHSGIDYIALVQAEHREATRRSINFADLPANNDAPVRAAPAASLWPFGPPSVSNGQNNGPPLAGRVPAQRATRRRGGGWPGWRPPR